MAKKMNEYVRYNHAETERTHHHHALFSPRGRGDDARLNKKKAYAYKRKKERRKKKKTALKSVWLLQA